MIRMSVWWSAAVGLAIVAVGPALAQEVLTNDSVIKMVKAGLPESVVVAKIQSTRSAFDLHADALIALKRAGVPGKVMDAMLAQQAQQKEPAAQRPPGSAPLPVAMAPPPPPPASPSPAPAPGLPSASPAATPPPAQPAARPGVSPGSAGPLRAGLPPGSAIPRDRLPIYQLVGDKYEEIEANIGEIQTNRVFMEHKVEFVLGGARAGFRTSERQPVFFSSYSSAEAPLVRLKPGERDRNLKIASGVRIGPWGDTQRRGVRAEDRIEVQAERHPSGYFRIVPRQPLPPGEYGFVLTQEIAGAASGKIWDFGVD